MFKISPWLPLSKADIRDRCSVWVRRRTWAPSFVTAARVHCRLLTRYDAHEVRRQRLQHQGFIYIYMYMYIC